MAWIGYRKTKYNFLERMGRLFKGYGLEEYKIEFRLVTIRNTDKFHAYFMLEKEDGGLQSQWCNNEDWQFLKVPIKSFKTYVDHYKGCKYDPACDYMTGFLAGVTSNTNLINSIFEQEKPVTHNPEQLLNWLLEKYNK